MNSTWGQADLFREWGSVKEGRGHQGEREVPPLTEIQTMYLEELPLRSGWFNHLRSGWSNQQSGWIQ